MDAHLEALKATQKFIGSETDIVEITYRTPFGFHEIPRENIGVMDFLRPEYRTRHAVGLLHILLGCGVPLDIVVNVINKATSLCDRVIILEHNKASMDWDWSNQFEVEDHFLNNCISYEDFWNLCELYMWTICRDAIVPGVRSEDRNMVFELFGGLSGWQPTNHREMVEQLDIPSFAHLQGPENYSHAYDVYAGSAEPTVLLLSNTLDEETGQVKLDWASTHTRNEIKHLAPVLFPQPYKLYACCGGFFSFNTLLLFKDTPITGIDFFDINPYTIDFAPTVIRLIKYCPTRLQFIQNYCMANVALTPYPQFIKTSWSERLKFYLENIPLSSEQGKFMFKLLLNSEVFPSKLRVFGLRNCANNRTDQPGYLELVHDGDHYVEENSLNIGQEGWLETDQTYLDIQSILMRIPCTFSTKSIEDLTPQPEDLILASNIIENVALKRKLMPCKVVHHRSK